MRQKMLNLVVQNVIMQREGNKMKISKDFAVDILHNGKVGSLFEEPNTKVRMFVTHITDWELRDNSKMYRCIYLQSFTTGVYYELLDYRVEDLICASEFIYDIEKCWNDFGLIAVELPQVKKVEKTVVEWIKI